MYEVIDHTADIGIKVEGASEAELFVSAAEALFDICFESKKNLTPSIEVPIEIDAPALDQLFVRWLSELLYLYETRRLVFSRFYMDEMSQTHLSGVAKGLKFDSTRHTQKLAIKAVTYHQLKVERDPTSGLWLAEVIFDI